MTVFNVFITERQHDLKKVRQWKGKIINGGQLRDQPYLSENHKCYSSNASFSHSVVLQD